MAKMSQIRLDFVDLEHDGHSCICFSSRKYNLLENSTKYVPWFRFSGIIDISWPNWQSYADYMYHQHFQVEFFQKVKLH